LPKSLISKNKCDHLSNRIPHPVRRKKLQPFRDGWHNLIQIFTLILVFNPARLFILPGALLMGLSIAYALILNEHPIVTPCFGLDIHSFILAFLDNLTGFQLVTFGMGRIVCC